LKRTTLNMSCFEVVVPLMGDEVACPVCEKEEAHFFFMTLEDLDKHLNEHHVDIPIQRGCFKYRKSFFKLNGARCLFRNVATPCGAVRVDSSVTLAS
jgi:hypothetical protein